MHPTVDAEAQKLASELGLDSLTKEQVTRYYEATNTLKMVRIVINYSAIFAPSL
jgi:hypothetical protein